MTEIALKRPPRPILRSLLKAMVVKMHPFECDQDVVFDHSNTLPRSSSWASMKFIPGLEFDGRKFVFNRSIPVQLTSDEDQGCSHEYDDLGIIGYGRTEEESWQSFAIEFVCCWDAIAMEDAANLTIDAQALGFRMRQLVKKVW